MDWDRSPVLSGDRWQMTFGERAALAGLVADVRPRIAIEIGTASGGSLECLAAHSEEVHSLDLYVPSESPPENVRVHTGDSKLVLPRVLAELAAQGRNVDFVLVDGDHSAAGVRTDLENLLASPALGRTLIVLHDSMNDAVRRGLEATRVGEKPGVVYADFDLVPGFIAGSGKFEGERWGGLGLVVVDREGGPWREGIYENLHVDQHLALSRAGNARPGAGPLARRAKARAIVFGRTLLERARTPRS